MRRGQTPCDLGVGFGVGIVFDQQIDVRGDRRVGIGNGAGRIAGVVVEHHVDRQGAGSKLEAAPHLGAGEAKALQRHARCLVEIREARSDTAAASALAVPRAAVTASPARSGRRATHHTATGSPRG